MRIALVFRKLLENQPTYYRTNRNLHVYVYQEEGTITTSFDMRVQSEIDRYHLVQSVINNLSQLGNKSSYLLQKIQRYVFFTKALQNFDVRTALFRVE